MDTGNEALSDKQKAPTDEHSLHELENALVALRDALEQHWIAFARCVFPYRGNPGYRCPGFRDTETIDDPNWPINLTYVEDHQTVLREVRYAYTRAYEIFGDGEGLRAYRTVGDENGNPRNEEIPGGTLPAWRLVEYGPMHLEETSQAIRDAVSRVRRLDNGNRFGWLASLASDVVLPKGESVWRIPNSARINENIPWGYPAKLEQVMGDARAACTEVFQQSGPNRIKRQRRRLKGGRPSTEDRDRRLLDLWESGTCRTYSDVAREMGITGKDPAGTVGKALKRARRLVGKNSGS